MADPSSQEAASQEARADAAAARGDLATARACLGRVTELEPRRVEPWLKLAAMSRAAGDLQSALAAVHGALRIDPLAFLPLLLKATLLDSAGKEEEAGETYGYALAQLNGEPPMQLAPMVAQARAKHAAYIERQRARLTDVVLPLSLGDEEARRLERFRSNILRETKVYHSDPSHFHYPGLREREYHERGDFPFLAELEAATDAITADFHRVMAAERAQLVPYIQYPDEVPLRQWAELNRNRAWTAIHLVQNGEVVQENARHCPATMELLHGIDQPSVPRRGPNVMFSLLAPGAHIPPHTGVANTRLVCHLPLIVPPGCWFRVGADRREWEIGKAWVFDDTIEHEAMNPSDQVRVILILDLWHPDLSAAERQAVSAVMAATDQTANTGL